MTDFLKCRKPDCLRKVKPSVAYCCDTCATAAEAPAPYEIEPHDPSLHLVLCHRQSCEERSAERGECTWAEAVALTQH